MIDRKIAPEAHGFDSVSFLHPEVYTLDNGIKVYSINAGSQELVKIDLIFEAGACNQPFNLVAGLTNAFLNQGSKEYTAQQIAETFDYRGAYLQLSADQHHGIIDILTLNKYTEDVLRIVADIVKHPTFPKKEIDSQLIKKRQQFIVENSKVKVLAQKAFSRALFGEMHPYANTNKIEDYDRLTRFDFVDFHKKTYGSSRCKIIVAGRFENEMPALLNQYFGGNDWDVNGHVDMRQFQVVPAPEQKIFVLKNDALQSAIRVGKQVINRDHDDYWGLTILTTLLGGYFGSRLMTNIREEKGYTYGIGAGIMALPNAAYLTISSEVGNDVCQAALNEVYFEMKKLQAELIPDHELDMVRNYLMGEMLRSFDGIFAMSHSLKTLLDFDLEYSHYTHYIETLQNITPAELRNLAIKYYQTEELYEIIAGKKV